MNAVCYCMAALHRLPCIVPVAVLRVVPLYPAYGSWIKQYLSAHERIYPCRLRHPLVITDEDAYGCESGFIDLIAQIAAFKIILLIEELIKWDMYLAIYAQYVSAGIYGNGGI